MLLIFYIFGLRIGKIRDKVERKYLLEIFLQELKISEPSFNVIIQRLGYNLKHNCLVSKKGHGLAFFYRMRNDINFKHFCVAEGVLVQLFTL
jgi:hypothetical protein